MNFPAKTKSFVNCQTVTNVFWWLLQKQAGTEVDREVFDGDLLIFKYFVSIFREVVETKLDVERDKLGSIHKVRLL